MNCSKGSNRDVEGRDVMMTKNKNKPLALDAYSTRKGKLDYFNKHDNIYAGLIVSYLAVILFVVIDYSCLKASWTTVQNENKWLTTLLSVGCAVVLDVPMAIAAISVKMYHQKLIGKRECIIILALCLAAFLISFGFQVGFRIVTRNSTFSETEATIKNTLSTSSSGGNTEESPIVWSAALFSGFIPLCTSVASFVITYIGYNPLAIRIYRLQNMIIQTDSNLIELEQALSEVSNTKEHMDMLVANENDKLAAHLMQIDAQGNHVKQVVRSRVMKKLGTPEQVAIVQQSGEELNEKQNTNKLPSESVGKLSKSRLEVVA